MRSQPYPQTICYFCIIPCPKRPDAKRTSANAGKTRQISLHPEMLRLLAGLLREASSRTLLIVATHSDRFVRFLEPAELVVCDLDEAGGTMATRANELDLDMWVEDYNLDPLWSMGRLGGRA